MDIKSKSSILKIVLALLLLSQSQLQATNYYFKLSGNDSYAGTSPATAWKSLSKLNSVTLYAGDSVLLNGGDTLAGNIYISPNDSGTASYPIVISSFGIGTCTLNAGNSYGVLVYNTGGITIQNLTIIGSGMNINTNSGILFYTDVWAAHVYGNIAANNLLIEGFGDDGILIGCDDSLYRGFQNITISNVTARENGSGILTYDPAGYTSQKYAFSNLYISYCDLLYNSKNGLVVGGVNNGLIEHCRASYTGYNTNLGIVGIWAWSSKNVTIQHCISDHTTTTGGDGDGFDLDGGTNQCTIQYCYSFQNYGCGYMHCDYPYSRPTGKNIIRYNISENEGRKLNKGGSDYLFVSWGAGLDSCDMYNNDAYITDNDTFMVNGLSADVLSQSFPKAHFSHCTARNNIFYVDGISNNSLVYFYSDTLPIADTGILLQGNNYYATNPTSNRWINNNKIYTTLKSWQDSTNQEKLGSSYIGFNTNPLLNNAGMGGTVLNTDSLIYLSAYKTQPTSPMIDSGLNLESLFGCNIGRYDFYGDTSKNGSQDIGCYETIKLINAAPSTAINKNTIVYPNPVESMLTIENSEIANGADITLTDLLGQVLFCTHTALNPTHLDMRKYEPGFYFLQVRTSEKMEVMKIIKK